MFSGHKTADVVRDLMDAYGVSRSAVEKWMQLARPKVEEMRLQADSIKRQENEKAIVESAQKLNITREGVMQLLWNMANGNLQDYFTPNGNAISISKLPRDKAALLASVEVDELYHGAAGSRYWVGQTKKFKLHDPVRAIDLINKMNGWYKDDGTPVKLDVRIGYGKEVPI